MTSKMLSKQLVAEGYVKKIDARYYWDSHGTKFWDFQEPNTFNFDSPKKFEFYKETFEYNSEYVGTRVFEFFNLYVEGEKLDVGDITSFTKLKTKIKIEVCVGAG